MPDSRTVVKALLEVDPQFSTLCHTMFGEAVDPAEVWEFLYTREGVAKMNPAPSDLNAGGGVLRRKLPPYVPGSVPDRGLKAGLKAGRLMRRATPMIGASVVGGVIANQLPQNQKDSRRIGRKKFTITDTSGKRVSFDSATERNTAYLVMRDQSKQAKKVAKSDGSVEWGVEFSKVDDDKRQVFGWASIVKMNGQPIVDRQGDLIDPEEIEKAAYSYVEKSRKGGHQHRRTDDDEPFHASDMIESIVFTDEKIAKMGLPEDFPRGWWVGYQVRDEETWQKVKKGEVTGFSIHGRGRRQEVPA